ncbi:MAG: helix-turn-helix transcriptional regulator [Clostridia bacterium]|nr:helix-turn-helix transcriptional regulator [Clostridia bacterium]
MIELFFYRHNKKGYAQEIPLAEINFFELTLVLKGKLEYEINNKKYIIEENDGIFIKSGELRKRKNTEGVDYVSFNFHGFEGDFPTHLQKIVNSPIKLLTSVCDEIHEKIYDGDSEITLALKLILELINNYLSVSRENPLIFAIKQYIHTNLTQKININELSSNVGYSPNYCSTIFKKYTKLTIIDYLNAERIEESKRLINENILSLSQIAFSVGFEDYNYFSRTFKKINGYTPTEYKKLVNAK